MGCASSAKLKPVATDTVPVLREFPEVVDKPTNAMKGTESNNAAVNDDPQLDNPNNMQLKNNDKENIEETDSSEDIVQNIFTDDGSLVSNSSTPNSTPSIRPDSLRTSSPESEIEKVFVNDKKRSLTPTPTFAEFQSLTQLAIDSVYSLISEKDDATYHLGTLEPDKMTSNDVIKSDSLTKKLERFDSEEYIKRPTKDGTVFAGTSTNCDSNNLIEEVAELSNILSKSDPSDPLMLNQPTEWEKQADMLASSKKYNPIEAMRKYRRENKASHILPQKGELNQRSQIFEEDLTDLFSTQSPTVRSVLSSAASERSMKNRFNPGNIANNYSLPPKQNTIHDLKMNVHAVRNRKPNNNNRKMSTLTLPTKVRESVSPSSSRGRERCAVCSNKSKH